MSIKKYFIPDATFFDVFRSGDRYSKVRPWLTSLYHNSPLHWWYLTRGTKSVLFGVHQFLWHPFTVWRAWRYLYKATPSLYGMICIFCHDLGYWGKEQMDSPSGQTHPEFGAKLAKKLVYWAARLRGETKDNAGYISKRAFKLCLFHSTHYANMKGEAVSALYLPDKACVLFDPPWFYLLRGKLSGEVYEYAGRENHARGIDLTVEEWLVRYRARIQLKVRNYFEPCQCDICVEKK